MHLMLALRAFTFNRSSDPIEPAQAAFLELIHAELVARYAPFMGAELSTRATSADFDNHIYYVQCWIQAFREKPESLVIAIKVAHLAAYYMEWKAGLITDMEYQKAVSSVLEIKQKPREHER